MNLPKCFLSGDPVLELIGVATTLEPYMLSDTCKDTAGDKDKILASQAYGSCYLKRLTQSAWGQIWAKHLVRYAEQRNLVSVGTFKDWRVYKYPNQAEVEAICSDGNDLHFRIDRNPSKSKLGYFLTTRGEFNLILDNSWHELIASIQSSLRTTGAYPVLDLFRALKLTQHLTQPEHLQSSLFLFDEELSDYWSDKAVSVYLEYDIYIPECLVDIWS